MSTIWIKYSDWLKIGNGRGILIYSAGQGLILDFCTEYRVVLSKDDRLMSRVMGKEQKAEWRSQHKKTTNRKTMCPTLDIVSQNTDPPSCNERGNQNC